MHNARSLSLKAFSHSRNLATVFAREQKRHERPNFVYRKYTAFVNTLLRAVSAPALLRVICVGERRWEQKNITRSIILIVHKKKKQNIEVEIIGKKKHSLMRTKNEECNIVGISVVKIILRWMEKQFVFAELLRRQMSFIKRYSFLFLPRDYVQQSYIYETLCTLCSLVKLTIQSRSSADLQTQWQRLCETALKY